MEWVEIIGYFLAILVGCLLGLMGSGGSLIVPIMVYLFTKDIVVATAYAMFMVGLTASFGVGLKLKRKEVDLRIAFAFAVPVIIGTLIARIYVIRLLPDVLFHLGDFAFSKRAGIMVLFSSLLLLSFISMVSGWGNRPEGEVELRKPSLNYYLLMAVLGVFIGIVTSLVGAGGGVLAVPVLVIIAGLPIKMAVGTSLTIASLKSLLGFLTEVYQMGDSLEWGFLLSISVLMIGGIFLGSYIARFIPGAKLKKGFAAFLLAMASFIMFNEFYLSA